MTPIPAETQNKILASIRSLVPDGSRARNDRRHQIFLGVIVALQAQGHELVPPHWLMAVMSGRTGELFSPAAQRTMEVAE